MKPAGVILTFMGREDWKGSVYVKLRTAFFNCKLFVGQLTFMVVGTVIGKIKWPKVSMWQRLFCAVCAAISFGGFLLSVIVLNYYFIALFFVVFILWLLEYRGIPWRRVWRAAQCSHVRLCLKYIPYTFSGYREGLSKWQYINFGYPKAELEYWRIDQCKGQFEYRRPTFETSDRFIEAMIGYAEKQVGKPYDTLQLFSYGLNFIVWLFWWPLWGREVFRWLNLRGGREVCSSGVTADLRWAGSEPDVRENWDYFITVLRYRTKFFHGYHTAMVWPCQFAIDRNWRER